MSTSRRRPGADLGARRRSRPSDAWRRRSDAASRASMAARGTASGRGGAARGAGPFPMPDLGSLVSPSLPDVVEREEIAAGRGPWARRRGGCKVARQAREAGRRQERRCLPDWNRILVVGSVLFLKPESEILPSKKG